MSEEEVEEDFLLVSVPGLFEDHDYTWLNNLQPTRPPAAFDGHYCMQAVVQTSEYIEDVLNGFRNKCGTVDHGAVVRQLAVDYPRGRRLLNKVTAPHFHAMLATLVTVASPCNASALLTQASLAIPLVMLMQMFSPLHVGEVGRGADNVRLAPIQTWHLITTTRPAEIHITKWLRCFYVDDRGEAVTTHCVRVQSIVPVTSRGAPLASVTFEIRPRLI